MTFGYLLNALYSVFISYVFVSGIVSAWASRLQGFLQKSI